MVSSSSFNKSSGIEGWGGGCFGATPFFSSLSCLERLSKIKLNIPFKVTPIILDDRMKIYELPENGSTRPCLAPLNEVLVTHDCKLALCCWDWKRQNVFGDLNTQSIEEILLSDEVRDLYEGLSNGKRNLEICKRCPHCR